MKLTACILMFVVILMSSPAYCDVLDELAERQKSGLTTVEAKFQQQKKSALLGKPIKSKGAFYFKSPMGVRWQYEEGLLVVYDGNYLYIYSREMEAVEKVKGVAAYTGPLAFDLGFLSKQFKMEASQSADRITLELTPKGKMPLEFIRMIFPQEGAAFPEEVLVKEETGDATTIKFYDVKANTALKDSLFIFKPPAGVKVRERTIEE